MEVSYKLHIYLWSTGGEEEFLGRWISSGCSAWWRLCCSHTWHVKLRQPRVTMLKSYIRN